MCGWGWGYGGGGGSDQGLDQGQNKQTNSLLTNTAHFEP